ncbi:MAG: hypothetical protein ACYS67_07205 [Planctomycetota bacterium]|jgi:type IV secretory pathway VirB3-like protein
MSEEEAKVKRKPRTISIIALIVGITTFLNLLLCLPFFLWVVIFKEADPEYDFIGMLLGILSIFPGLALYPLIAISLVLSVVTLFIEREKSFRRLPLAFVLAVISLYGILCILFILQ